MECLVPRQGAVSLMQGSAALRVEAAEIKNTVILSTPIQKPLRFPIGAFGIHAEALCGVEHDIVVRNLNLESRSRASHPGASTH